MYACHEEYIENILHRKCKNFYNVRGMIFAESFWIAIRNRSAEDWHKASQIWQQRKKKWPLALCTIRRGFGTLRRRAKKLIR